LDRDGFVVDHILAGVRRERFWTRDVGARERRAQRVGRARFLRLLRASEKEIWKKKEKWNIFFPRFTLLNATYASTAVATSRAFIAKKKRFLLCHHHHR